MITNQAVSGEVWADAGNILPRRKRRGNPLIRPFGPLPPRERDPNPLPTGERGFCYPVSDVFGDKKVVFQRAGRL